MVRFLCPSSWWYIKRSQARSGPRAPLPWRTLKPPRDLGLSNQEQPASLGNHLEHPHFPFLPLSPGWKTTQRWPAPNRISAGTIPCKYLRNLQYYRLQTSLDAPCMVSNRGFFARYPDIATAIGASYPKRGRGRGGCKVQGDKMVLQQTSPSSPRPATSSGPPCAPKRNLAADVVQSFGAKR